MEFYKYHGTGNDFIMLNGMVEGPCLTSVEIADICNHHTGIGADGIIFACAPAGGADAAMRVFNADGSEAEMCGNGIRCLAKFLYERLDLRKKDMLIETGAGAKAVSLTLSGSSVIGAEVDMGLPELAAEDLPAPDDPSRPGEVTISMKAGDELRAFCVSMGNPHCVLFVTDAAEAPVTRLGPVLERHPLFPGRTNVEFAQIVDAHNVVLRVWERGVGETQACGTGACAAVAAAINSGKCESPVQVQLPGGTLNIRLDGGGHLLMSGPAVEIFCGELSEGWRMT